MGVGKGPLLPSLRIPMIIIMIIKKIIIWKLKKGNFQKFLFDRVVSKSLFLNKFLCLNLDYNDHIYNG